MNIIKHTITRYECTDGRTDPTGDEITAYVEPGSSDYDMDGLFAADDDGETDELLWQEGKELETHKAVDIARKHHCTYIQGAIHAYAESIEQAAALVIDTAVDMYEAAGLEAK